MPGPVDVQASLPQALLAEAELLDHSSAGLVLWPDGRLDPVQADGEEAVVAEEGAIAEEETVVAAEGKESAPGAEVEAGDVEGLSTEAEASAESVEELVESGQYYEAEVVEGVENVLPADEAEVTTHERPSVENENVPDEELPGEQR